MASINSTGYNDRMSDILSKLTTNERTRLTSVKAQQTLYENRDKSFDTLKSALEKLNTAAETLTKASSINKTSVSSTNTAFTATTDSKATNGNYSVEVKTLATAQSLISGEFTSNTAQQGSATENNTRTLTISQPGQDKPLEIKLTDNQTSLVGIRDAINKANGNVGASIVKVDDDTYYLSITAKGTGTDAKMTISVTGDDTLNSKLNYTSDTGAGSGAMTQQTAVQNASIKLNGMTIERQRNTISDVIDGVTLTLKSQTATNSSETLSIASDIAPMKTAVQNYVDAYNALQTTIGTLTKYTEVAPGSDAQSNSNGVLLGNRTVRGIQTSLKTQISSAQSGMDISTLNEMGVKQNPKTGMLEIDSDKLTTALTDNSSHVLDFFVGDGKTTGYSTQVTNYLDNVLDSSKGAIQTAKDSIAATLKTIKKTYDRTQQNIEDNIARYKAQFSQLDMLFSKMNSTGEYLAKQLAALNKSS
ncbi:flagellar filament capping protein FliD [Candidatus Symbiopectobacterium sp.]|uniref:flagellar filament capping protein FliD n=1 Tax=Candidatus Symbiopectobacterium sp. TaxID=2816440 RepID=UPI0025C32FA7|nr:flagellar filament capping protein FliD [Candidatus Symbiopectobacterium sp.]